MNTTPMLSAIDTLKLDGEMQMWYSTLPSYAYPQAVSSEEPWLTFAQYKMKWRYLNLRTILHRRLFLERAIQGMSLARANDIAHVREEADAITCCQLCQDCASEVIDSTAQFFAINPNYSRLEGWYAL